MDSNFNRRSFLGFSLTSSLPLFFAQNAAANTAQTEADPKELRRLQAELAALKGGQAGSAPVFKTLAEAKAKARDYAPGQVILVQGYTFSQDGGGFLGVIEPQVNPGNPGGGQIQPLGPRTPEMFGANGYDDSQAFAQMLSTPGEYDLGGRRYVVSRKIDVAPGVTLRNGEIDARGLRDTTLFRQITPDQPSVRLNANALSGASEIWCNLQARPGDLVFLASDQIFAKARSVTVYNGEQAIVAGVYGESILLQGPLRYDYELRSGATARVLPLGQGMRCQNVTFLGDNSGAQKNRVYNGVRVRNSAFEGCRIDGFHARGVVWVNSRDCSAQNCSFVNVNPEAGRGNGTGFNAIDGCTNVTVDNCMAHSSKGLFDTGGKWPNYDLKVTNCRSLAARNAGINTHPSSDKCLISGNTVEVVDGADGIIYQGGNGVLINNTVDGNARHGVFVECFLDAGGRRTSSYIVADNQVRGGGQDAVKVSASGVGPQPWAVESASVTGNLVQSSYGVWRKGIAVKAGRGDVRGLNIANNTVSSFQTSGIALQALEGRRIEGFSIANNTIIGAGNTPRGVHLHGADPGGVRNGSVTYNRIEGVRRPSHMVNADGVAENGNY